MSGLEDSCFINDKYPASRNLRSGRDRIPDDERSIIHIDAVAARPELCIMVAIFPADGPQSTAIV